MRTSGDYQRRSRRPAGTGHLYQGRFKNLPIAGRTTACWRCCRYVEGESAQRAAWLTGRKTGSGRVCSTVWRRRMVPTTAVTPSGPVSSRRRLRLATTIAQSRGRQQRPTDGRARFEQRDAGVARRLPRVTVAKHATTACRRMSSTSRQSKRWLSPFPREVCPVHSSLTAQPSGGARRGDRRLGRSSSGSR